MVRRAVARPRRRVAVLLRRRGRPRRRELVQQSVGDAVDPAMHGDLLAARPGVAEHGALADVSDLLGYIELAKPPVLLVRAREPRDLRSVLPAYVLHVAQPVVAK